MKPLALFACICIKRHLCSRTMRVVRNLCPVPPFVHERRHPCTIASVVCSRLSLSPHVSRKNMHASFSRHSSFVRFPSPHITHHTHTHPHTHTLCHDSCSTLSFSNLVVCSHWFCRSTPTRKLTDCRKVSGEGPLPFPARSFDFDSVQLLREALFLLLLLLLLMCLYMQKHKHKDHSRDCCKGQPAAATHGLPQQLDHRVHARPRFFFFCVFACV